MTDDDPDLQARKARAASLRRQIDRLTAAKREESSAPEPKKPKSPREFIHERMKELPPEKKP